MAYDEAQEIIRLDNEWEESDKVWNLQLNERASLQGSATCFCLNEEKKGVPSDQLYKLSLNSIRKVDICGEYYDKHLSKTWTGMASFYMFFAKYIGFFVIGMNFACRQIFIRLAFKIGYTS